MKKRKPNIKKMGEIDFGIFCVIILLLAVGVVMVYSASSYYSMFKYDDSMHYLKRQLIWCILGVIAMMVMMTVDYHKLKRWTFILLIATVPILLAVFLFPGVNGAQRWIQLGPFSFQPSELAKYVIVIYVFRKER